MIYREWLVMRKRASIYLAAVLALLVLFTAGAIAIGKYHSTLADMVPGGAWFAAAFASIAGVALGNSSRDGARLFWTLPVARYRSGLEVIAVDMAAIIVVTASVLLLSTAVTAGFIGFAGGSNHFEWTAPGGASVALTFALPPAIYGWSAFVGMLGRRIPFLGIIVMPVLMLWYGFADIPGVAIDVLRDVTLLNPAVVYAYGSFSTAHPRDFAPLVAAFYWVTPPLAAVVLLATAAAGCAAAVTMWSRSEVLA